MSTNSLIGIQNVDGSVTASYCHYDGYVSGVGQTLVDYYDNGDDAEDLCEGGYISALYPTARESWDHSVHEDGPEKYDTVVDFYQQTDNSCIEYVYLWTETKGWQVYSQGGLYNGASLKNVLMNLMVDRPADEA